MAKLTNKEVNDAVNAMRLYMGSDGYCRILDCEKLYRRYKRKIDSICKKLPSLTSYDIEHQIMERATQLGKIMPIVGKDI